MKELLHRFWAGDDAQDIAEYALMLTTVLLIVVAVVSAAGNNSNSVFSAVSAKNQQLHTPGTKSGSEPKNSNNQPTQQPPVPATSVALQPPQTRARAGPRHR